MKQSIHKKVLAVASFGGHWRQLLYLKDALNGMDVFYMTTTGNEVDTADIKQYITVSDCNKNTPIQSVKCFLEVAIFVFRYRPNIVITTGAAPGLFAIIISKVFGAKTIWIDSIANANELSLCGKLSKYFASITLSQWPDVASKYKVKFLGSIL